MPSQKIIGVIGGGKCSAAIYTMAEEVGCLIAENKFLLICGGLFGVMEAACKGAKDGGGKTIGVLPGLERTDANDYVDIPIVTGMADARNLIIVRSASAVIAIGGEYGTLSEISFSLKFNVPIVGLKTWAVSPAINQVNTAKEAVAKAISLINK